MTRNCEATALVNMSTSIIQHNKFRLYALSFKIKYVLLPKYI